MVVEDEESALYLIPHLQCRSRFWTFVVSSWPREHRFPSDSKGYTSWCYQTRLVKGVLLCGYNEIL